MHRLIFCLLCFLSACDTPTVGFAHTDSRKLTVGQNHFVVYFNETEAQAVRLNNQSLSGLRAAARDGVTAIETATACRVVKVHPKSDPVLTRATLSC